MRLDPSSLLDRFDASIASLCQAHEPAEPGFSAALVVDGVAVRRVHRGRAHLEWPQPLAGDTRYYLASESKVWVAALVMAAVAAGRITLDTDMRRHLPALAPCEQPVRLGHLLRHTSGVDDYLYLWHMQLGHDENDLVTQAQALALIHRAGDVDFEPGTRYEYSNSNYVLLADWLERDAGVPLADLARQRLFEPWGLHDTGFENDPQRVLPRRAASYAPATTGGWRALPVNLGTWGDGGLWSTLDDLVRAEAHWLDDWRRQGEDAWLARCAREDARFAPPGQPYRFGIEQQGVNGQPLLFHGGAFAAFSSMVMRCPADGWALILLSNRQGFDASASTWLDRLGPPAHPAD